MTTYSVRLTEVVEYERTFTHDELVGMGIPDPAAFADDPYTQVNDPETWMMEALREHFQAVTDRGWDVEVTL